MKPVGMNQQTKQMFPSCVDCRCKTRGCFEKAMNEKGLCQAHFRAPVPQQPQQQQQLQLDKICKMCGKESRGQYCNFCYKTFPQCKNCNQKKVIINDEDGKFFTYCQTCKCASRICDTKKPSNGQYCRDCELNSVCQECGGPKSTNHQSPLCRRCQIPQCKTEDCENRTGFSKDENGEEFAFEYCKGCTCDSKGCYNGKINAWYCEDCNSKHQNFCKATNCNKPIHAKQEYCIECERAWNDRGLVKCLSTGCKNYRFPKFDICASCYNSEP